MNEIIKFIQMARNRIPFRSDYLNQSMEMNEMGPIQIPLAGGAFRAPRL
jgi:hypothetical protein